MTPRLSTAVVPLAALLFSAVRAWGWGAPHGTITQAALKALGDEPTILLRRDQLNAEQSRLRNSLAAAEARATNDVPQQAAAEDPAAKRTEMVEQYRDTF